MVVLLAAVLPLALLVVATTQLQIRYNTALHTHVAEERALLAAEAGLQYALHLVATTGLPESTFVTIRPGLSFTLTAVSLGEGQYEIDSLGRFANTTQWVGAVLTPGLAIPSLNAAMSLQNPEVTFMPMSWSTIAVVVGNDSHGIVVNGQPDPTFLDAFDTAQKGQVTGKGESPSIDFAERDIDFASIISSAELYADIVLTKPTYKNPYWGTETDPQVTFASGNLNISGTSRGYGTLIVGGNLQLKGDFEFHGVIVVVGNINLKDEAAELDNGFVQIIGAIVQGDKAAKFKVKGQTTITYDASAISSARNLLRISVGAYKLRNWHYKVNEWNATANITSK